jgi:hypothetical protein
LRRSLHNFAAHVKNGDEDNVRAVLNHVGEISRDHLPPVLSEDRLFVPVVDGIRIPPMGHVKLLAWLYHKLGEIQFRVERHRLFPTGACKSDWEFAKSWLRVLRYLDGDPKGLGGIGTDGGPWLGV